MAASAKSTAIKENEDRKTYAIAPPDRAAVDRDFCLFEVTQICPLYTVPVFDEDIGYLPKSKKFESLGSMLVNLSPKLAISFNGIWTVYRDGLGRYLAAGGPANQISSSTNEI
ncbi:hypothetical protein GHT06_018080 [Daphnia sinensis]|uniref:Uncharacterized protein n=1 Tax=Daphnia sinensis TaxID=1820382 RepID=A0AAD5L3K6_9CRUS|nr:hypothetical protein GHT06_018080 [Daphnia sinensis]